MWGVVDVDEPFRGAQEFQAVDEVNLETLVSFGFKPDVACKALRATVGMTLSNLYALVRWCHYSAPDVFLLSCTNPVYVYNPVLRVGMWRGLRSGFLVTQRFQVQWTQTWAQGTMTMLPLNQTCPMVKEVSHYCCHPWNIVRKAD